MNIDYNETIPNNVGLADDRRLLRALERWQPAYLEWWNNLGPAETGDFEVYLRTAISVEADGWAHYGHVRMPEYRWGIFLAPPEENREIAFGQHKGEPVWADVPGEYRTELRRLIVTQGDTEPASVEQPYFEKKLISLWPSIIGNMRGSGHRSRVVGEVEQGVSAPVFDLGIFRCSRDHSSRFHGCVGLCFG